MSDRDTDLAAPTVDGMPMLGLGTWENDNHDECAGAVRTALETGYRHVDTAQIYGNEAAVGEGIATADVDRDDVFLATKVWTSNLAPEDVLASTEESLDRLETEYVDLLYVHWPAGSYDPATTLSAFDELRDSGRIERVGVSNFEPTHVERAREVLAAPVFANQVELHPHLPQRSLREFADETDLTLVAYSPLIRGDAFDDPVVAEIAAKHDVTAAQVSLAWLREAGITAIPKATSAAHIRDNWASLRLDLDDGDLARIDDIGDRTRKVHPGFAPDAWD